MKSIFLEIFTLKIKSRTFLGKYEPTKGGKYENAPQSLQKGNWNFVGNFEFPKKKGLDFELVFERNSKTRPSFIKQVLEKDNLVISSFIAILISYILA